MKRTGLLGLLGWVAVTAAVAPYTITADFFALR